MALTLENTVTPGKCRAAITTEWDTGRRYRRRVFDTIESYFVGSAFDTDADQWEVQLGDPDSNFMALLKRDAEIRVSIFGVGETMEYLATGFADQASYTTNGVWTISGRDVSSVPVDSIAPPQLYKHVRAKFLIASQARHLGLSGNLNLMNTPVYKREYTDGSESYWEFWYRLLRKDQMWLWASPDGSLNSGYLNYSDEPTYYLGEPPSSVKKAIAEKYIPAEESTFTKNVQNRIYEAWVQGHKGDVGFVGKAKDPQIAHWIKKPRKLFDESKVQNQKSAVRHAWEELFESKVGELEFNVIISDPQYFIRQNRIARLSLPNTIDKEFFVVGTTLQANANGFYQEVRLREKQFAASRRVPDDPQLAYPPTREQIGTTGVNLATGAHQWGDYFVAAAREFSGPWTFNLFLAVLLGICHQETKFTNERVLTGNHDHLEWFDFKPHRDRPDEPILSHGLTYDQWKSAFENENPTRAVGPMQLYDITFKHWADDFMKAGFHDQLRGGRWHPQHNIRAAAKVLLGKLSGLPPRDENIWIGVRAYNGSGPAAETYMREVKYKVMKNPGYLQLVIQAYQASKAAQDAGSGPVQDQPVGSGPFGKGYSYHKNIVGFPYVGTHTDFGNWQSDNAVDIKAPKGTPVYAVHAGVLGNYGILPGSGKIVKNPSGSGQLAGNRVNIDGVDASSYYAHMIDLAPAIHRGREGMRIKAGQHIGYSGEANGLAHLHFAVKPPASPFHYIPGGDPRKS